MNEPDITEQHSHRRRRRKSRKRGPLFATIYLSLIGLQWVALFTLVLVYLRPHPLVPGDIFMGALGMCVGGFYLWSARGVYMRRRYIYTPAFACGSFGLLGFPFGTVLSILLLTNLAAHRHELTK